MYNAEGWMMSGKKSACLEPVPGELIGVTAVTAGSTFEVGAVAVAWGGLHGDHGDSPLIPIQDFRSSCTVTRLQELAEQADPCALNSLLNEQEFLSAMGEYWNSVGAGPAGQFCGVKADAPGQDMLTTRHENQHRIGIHLDNWHRFPARTRQMSPRRLALNIGPGPRWLLLVDTREFWREICDRGDGEKAVGTNQLRIWLLAHARPVYRYRIPPGFAYLAATEYYGHDGSTRWAKAPSVTAQWTNVATGPATPNP
jgi:hypothetical protein